MKCAKCRAKIEDNEEGVACPDCVIDLSCGGETIAIWASQYVRRALSLSKTCSKIVRRCLVDGNENFEHFAGEWTREERAFRKTEQQVKDFLSETENCTGK